MSVDNKQTEGVAIGAGFTHTSNSLSNTLQFIDKNKLLDCSLSSNILKSN